MKWLVVALLWLAAGQMTALAQEPASGVYRDDDAAAAHLGIAPGNRSAFRASINASLRKNPRNVAALVHRAYLFNDTGDTQRAMRDFDAALHASASGGEQRRHVLWSRGWARYDQGDYPGAVSDWQDAVALHGGRPAWAPYTLALGHWSLGDQALALRWFTAAVAANPSLATEAGMARRIERWRVPQQQAMRALHAAWKRDAGGAAAP